MGNNPSSTADAAPVPAAVAAATDGEHAPVSVPPAAEVAAAAAAAPEVPLPAPSVAPPATKPEKSKPAKAPKKQGSKGSTAAAAAASPLSLPAAGAADTPEDAAAAEAKAAEKALKHIPLSTSSKEDFAKHATKEATEHLMRTLKHLRSAAVNTKAEGYEVEPLGDNIYVWRVKLFGFEKDTLIHETMFHYEAATGKDHCMMEIVFPSDFPKRPFFLRMVYPRFVQYTGHITVGGSVCIKELTASGWDPSFALETFIVMIRDLLVSGQAIISMDNLTPYSESEARQAFVRVAGQHGWKA